MQRNIFSPKIETNKDDILSTFFTTSARTLLIAIFGLLPILFLPGVYTTLGFMKAFFVIVGVYLAIILVCLALLRSGKINIKFPLTLTTFWFFTFLAAASAFLSNDTHDSLFGSAFDPQSVAFFVLMASVMTLSLVFINARSAVAKLLLTAYFAFVVVFLFSLVKILFGSDVLAFGLFTSDFSSLVGSLNDLAIYAGFILITLLVAIYRITNSIAGRVLMLFTTVSALAVLAVVNFYFVWLGIGFFSLLTFLYLVAKDTWLKVPSEEVVDRGDSVSRFTLCIVAFICVVSGAFVVSGDYLGNKVAQLTGINYIEVRPSFTATLEVARAVYQENALFGIGPNRFEDAWRQYKNPVINDTQFWGTTFFSGNSFVSTIVITTGIAGSLLFIAFLASLAYAGYRFFFLTQIADANWRLVGLIAFAASGYLWTIAFFYSPGAFVLLLTAIVTGLALAVSITTAPPKEITIDVLENKRYGFALIAFVLLVVSVTTFAFIKVSNQLFTQDKVYTIALENNIISLDRALAEAAASDDKQDTYPAERARLRLAELNRLIAVASPTSDEQKRFELALAEGMPLAERAIYLDPTNPFNYALLGSFCGFISNDVYEGIGEKRDNAFNRALALDPTNPEYYAIQAQIANRFGQSSSSREYIEKALQLKSSYTDALYLLSQLDISEGNTASAIAATKAIISFEPTNPGRYFQLGLLYVATGEVTGAISAFDNAIALDPNYANARYMLALSYLDTERPVEALVQLKLVQVANPDNKDLAAFIEQIEAGNYTNPALGNEVPFTEEQIDPAVVTDLIDSDLVSPVNTKPRVDTDDTSLEEINGNE